MSRRITHVRKDKDGDITHVKGHWGYDAASVVINDIESGTRDYYTQEVSPRTDVHVSKTPAGKKYLRTDADGTSANNLDNLPSF